jgi:hypothetical protein
MAVTNISEWLDGKQKGMSFQKRITQSNEADGVYNSMWLSTGWPGAGSAPSSGLSGAALSAGATGCGVAGQLPFPALADGDSCYFNRGVVTTNVGSHVIFADRLWSNSGLVPTTVGAQTVTSAAFPARDLNGSSNGVGVEVGIEVFAATTNVGAVTTITMSYTNSDGTAGRTATIPSFPATCQPVALIPFTLQSGDQGVRSIQTVTLGTTLGGGTICLLAYRPFARASTNAASGGGAAEVTPIRGGMTQLYANTVPFIYYLPSAAGSGTTFTGKLNYVHG